MVRALALLLLSGCATARLVGERPPLTPVVAGPPRVVVLEPLFDRAEWKTSTRTELLSPPPGAVPMGSGLPMGSMPIGSTVGVGVGSTFGPSPFSPGFAGSAAPVAVTRTVTEKPLFARATSLQLIYERVLPVVRALRPGWTVLTPGAAATQPRDAVVVRTVIDNDELVESDRTLKNAAFAFGLVLLPLQIIAAFPVQETQRVTGSLEKAPATAEELRKRLVKYATQPDFAVNLSGLPTRRQGFALDVAYEEGLFADEAPRTSELVDGFVERLAYAIVTLVEEEDPP